MSCISVRGVPLKVKNRIKEKCKLYLLREDFILSVANIGALSIGFISSLLLPKWLGSQQYGIYTFLFVFLDFLCGILECGIVVSAARLLLTLDSVHERNSLMVLMGRILGTACILLWLITLAISFFIDDFYKEEIGRHLLVISFFSGMAFLPYFTTQLFKAYGCINKLSQYNFFYKLLYLVCIVAMIYTNTFSLNLCLMFSLLSSLIVFIYVYKEWLIKRADFSYKMLSALIHTDAQYGLKNYFSRLVGTQTTLLINLGIGYFIGVTDVGLYRLCNAFFAPALIIPQAMASVRYKKFNDYKAINRKYLAFHFVFTVLGNIFVFAVSLIIFNNYYNNVYETPYKMLAILLVTYIVMALYYPYNEWLSANGLGKEQLITGVIHGVMEMILAIVLVPLYGVLGAAGAMLASRWYFLLHTIVFYYRNVK